MSLQYLARIARKMDNAGVVDTSIGSVRAIPSFGQVNKQIQRIINNLYNRKEPHEKAGKYVQAQIRTAMTQGHSPSGKPWPKLKNATLARRARRGIVGSKPLIATGRLYRQVRYTIHGTRRAITRPTGFKVILPGSRRNAETVTRISPEQLGGVRNVRARVQQGRGTGTSTTVGSGAQVPSREFIEMSEGMKAHVGKIFRDFATNAIGGVI